jgi:hypothetical protein
MSAPKVNVEIIYKETDLENSSKLDPLGQGMQAKAARVVNEKCFQTNAKEIQLETLRITEATFLDKFSNLVDEAIREITKLTAPARQLSIRLTNGSKK